MGLLQAAYITNPFLCLGVFRVEQLHYSTPNTPSQRFLCVSYVFGKKKKKGVFRMDDMLERILDCIGPKRGATKALAEYLDISPNSITNWKNGHSKSYRAYIKQIAAYFNKPVEYFTGEAPETKKDPAAPSEVSESDLKFALFGGEATDKQLDEVRRFARFIKERDAK